MSTLTNRRRRSRNDVPSPEVKTYGSIEDIPLQETNQPQRKSRRHAPAQPSAWTAVQKDSADTICILAGLALWASFSMLIFVAQGDWFLNLVCSMLVVVSFSGIIGSFHGIRLGSILIFLFRTGLALISVFVVLYITLGTLEGSFEDDYAASRCGNATKTWRRNNFCTDSMSDEECEAACQSAVGKDLRIEMISCSAVVSAISMYVAYEVYKAEAELFPNPEDDESSA